MELFVPFSIFILNVVFDILTGTEKQRRANRAEELLGVISKQLLPSSSWASSSVEPDLFQRNTWMHSEATRQMSSLSNKPSHRSI